MFPKNRSPEGKHIFLHRPSRGKPLLPLAPDQALIYYDFCFPDEDSQQQQLDEIRQACLLNSAACFLACGELDQTLDCCYQVSRYPPLDVYVVQAPVIEVVVFRELDCISVRLCGETGESCGISIR